MIEPAVLRAYISKVGQMIHDNTEYPASARRQRAEGTATLSVTIERNGDITKSAIVEPVGNAALDRAIADSLSKLERVDPLPENYKAKKLSIQFKIHFQIYTP